MCGRWEHTEQTQKQVNQMSEMRTSRDIRREETLKWLKR